MVSVNHRLNILGFLDLSAYGDEYAYSANVGMLDIVKALEWIQENIESFGGNPNDVTIVGESGGGGKVGTLMYAPAENLFHKAIIMSGTLLNTMTKEKSQELAQGVLDKLGISPHEVEKLDTIPYIDLVKAGMRLLLNWPVNVPRHTHNVWIYTFGGWRGTAATAFQSGFCRDIF